MKKIILNEINFCLLLLSIVNVMNLSINYQWLVKNKRNTFDVSDKCEHIAPRIVTNRIRITFCVIYDAIFMFNIEKMTKSKIILTVFFFILLLNGKFI